MEQQIDISSDAWLSLLHEIAIQHSDGTLIPHEWLREKFGLKKLCFDDYDTTDDFLEAVKLQQFAYMSLVDKLRWQLLENEKLYIRNVRGDGYIVVNPKDQTQYGYNEFIKTVKQAIRESDMIMSNVRPVSAEQQYRDNDLRAKCSILKQMLQSIKR